MATTIRTNNQKRHIIAGYGLTEKERKEFDYLDDIDAASFFRYRGNVYDVGEFTRVPKSLGILGWDGYMSDSYFSGILIRLDDDGDTVTVATYYS